MDVTALPSFPTNLKPVLPGHPRHPSFRKGKSKSAAQRRRKAKAKYAAAMVRDHHEQLRTMPAARRRANILLREARHKKIVANQEKQARWRKERAERAKQAMAFERGELRPTFE